MSGILHQALMKNYSLRHIGNGGFFHCRSLASQGGFIYTKFRRIVDSSWSMQPDKLLAEFFQSVAANQFRGSRQR